MQATPQAPTFLNKSLLISLWPDSVCIGFKYSNLKKMDTYNL